MGKRAWQYPEATGITNDDVILLDSPTGGSRSIKANKIGSVLINKTITERGTFDAADDNVDGYKKVTVDVPYTDVEVASGPVASWDDGEDLPLKSLTIFIEPQQEGSGDPSPTNIRPISGWDEVNVTRCGKNLWGGLPLAQDIEQVAYQPSIDTTNKTLIFTNAKPIEGSYAHPISNGISYKENTQYTFIFAYKNNGKNNCLRISYTDGNVEAIELDNSSGTKIFKVFTTQSNKTIKDIILSYYSNAQTYLYYEESGLFEGVITADDFEPYNGQTYIIDLDGTRYGGTLDVISGVLTLDREFMDLGTLNWDKFTNSAKTYFRTSAQLPDAKKSDGATTTHNLMCSDYKEDSWTHVIDSSGYDENICIGWYNNAYIGIYDSRYVDASASDFKTAMNGVQLVYELATPITIQLTPTQVKSLVGKNNIYSNAGDVDVEYQKIWVRPSA